MSEDCGAKRREGRVMVPIKMDAANRFRLKLLAAHEDVSYEQMLIRLMDCWDDHQRRLAAELGNLG